MERTFRHRSHEIARLAAALALATAALAQPARAQPPVLVDLEGSAAMLVSEPQLERFGPGGGGSVGLRAPLDAGTAAVLRGSFVVFSDGPAPADRAVADPAVGSVLGASIGLRFRPEGWLRPDDGARASGFWMELDAGAGLTGSLLRPLFGAAVGYAFEIDSLRVGPEVRIGHLVHFDDPLDDGHALWASAGVELCLLDRRREPDAVVEEQVEEPVADRDRDGIPDRADGCPHEPEDRDGFDDGDGCPDLDDDADGLRDAEDGCPREPEDHDGFDDGDGCPDPDDDGDGIADSDDACPHEAEVLNGVEDRDGCPDRGLIEMHARRISIDEHVLFDLNRARVRHAARPILRAVVALLEQHAEWVRLRIEGHTDVQGDDEFNLALSERRAARVREVLIEMGIDPARLEIAAYGESRPRDTGRSQLAHQRNRRVELVVIEENEAEVGDRSGVALASASEVQP